MVEVRGVEFIGGPSGESRSLVKAEQRFETDRMKRNRIGWELLGVGDVLSYARDATCAHDTRAH